jgi:threonine dehydratase
VPTYAAIQEAAQRIRDGVIETRCTRTRAFRDLAPGNHYLKLENLQRTGSFKDRGALNRMLRLTEAERAREHVIEIVHRLEDLGHEVREEQ